MGCTRGSLTLHPGLITESQRRRSSFAEQTAWRREGLVLRLQSLRAGCTKVRTGAVETAGRSLRVMNEKQVPPLRRRNGGSGRDDECKNKIVVTKGVPSVSSATAAGPPPLRMTASVGIARRSLTLTSAI